MAAVLTEPFNGIIGRDFRNDHALALVAATYPDALGFNRRWCARRRHHSPEKLGKAACGSGFERDGALRVEEMSQIRDVHRRHPVRRNDRTIG